MDLSKAILSAAKAELRAGAREIGDQNMGRFVEKYLRPSGLRPPQPWCAAFASWCVQQAAEKCHAGRLPYFVSAREMFHWAKASGFLQADPLPGSLVFFARGGLFSWKGHCGIVASVGKATLVTIEGNRSNRVQTFAYDLRKVPKLLGFAGVRALE